MSQPSIVIVGGGVAGLAMANALAVRGFRSTVLEARGSPGEIDRGDVIHQSVIAILKNWNIYEVLLQQNPLQFTHFQILSNTGGVIFNFDLARDLDPAARFTVLRHPQIEIMLEETALKTGHVSIRRNVHCSDLLIDSSGRVSGVLAQTGEFPAQLTIVANGAQSSLRDKHFVGRVIHKYPVAFYNARFKAIPEFTDAGRYVLGEKGNIIMVPLPNNEMRIGIQYDRANKPENISPRTLKQTILERLSTFPVQNLEFIGGHLYPLTKSLNASFATSGAVLIGDAAHTTHPVGGQGMNLAFQDAECLAKYLADIDLHPDLIDKACSVYSSQRRNEVKAVLLRTHVMGLISLIDSPALIKTRESLLKIVNNLPSAKRATFKRIVEVY